MLLEFLANPNQIRMSAPTLDPVGPRPNPAAVPPQPSDATDPESVGAPIKTVADAPDGQRNVS